MITIIVPEWIVWMFIGYSMVSIVMSFINIQLNQNLLAIKTVSEGR